jgi:type I restriction enzyme, S subunit
MGILKKSSLPIAWSVSTISDINLVNPTVEKSIISDDMEVSFVPMAAVQAESGMVDISRIRKFSEVKKGYTPFCEGDILFAKITPCMENGKMAIVPALRNEIGFGSTEFHVLRPLSFVNTKFVYFFVSSKIFRSEAERYMSGAVGQRRVTTPYLSLSEIPLPPLPEQHCIVEKIEELFSELDNGIESLKKAREQLKTYRQAVLKHAFEGKLTREWREQQIQAGNPPEPAEKLLAHIKKERKTKYQKQVEAWQKACEQAKTDGSKKPAKPKKPKDLPPLTEKELAELPELPDGVGVGKIDKCYKSNSNWSLWEVNYTNLIIQKTEFR